MDLISRYYDLLEYVSLFAVDSGMKCLEVLTNPPDQLLTDIEQLVDMRLLLLNEVDYCIANQYSHLANFPDATPEIRASKTCVLLELENETSLLRLKRSCEPYDKGQPMFNALPQLWEFVRTVGHKDKDLIDARSLNLDSFYQLALFPNTKVAIHSHLSSDLVKWVINTFSELPYYFRLNPYNVSSELKPILTEAVERPCNPKWMKALRLWKNSKDSAVYTNETSSPDDHLENYIDYAIKGISRLEVHFHRDNSGLLSGLIEEISTKPEIGNYIVNRSIHLTSIEPIGTSWVSALTEHIDGAINIYVGQRINERIKVTLESGRVCDATFRTHLFRIEHAPLKSILPLSEMFFLSKALVNDWTCDMFAFVEQ